jgi:glycosyltransferase involved in cell wall biosynthesis
VATAFFGRRTALLAFDHNNLDDLTSRVKQWSFRKLSRRVHHLVLEPYMLDVVRRFGGPKVHCSVVPLPIRYFAAAGAEDVMDGSVNARLCCVGPSRSNDESFVKWIIHEEASTGALRQHRVSLVLHSTNESFDDGWLHVYHRHLDDNAYESLLLGADLVVLPYPRIFENRMSGVLLEALSCRRHWIGTDIPMFRNYALIYPMLGQVCQTYEELLLALLQVTREELRMTPDSAWDAVAAAHSRAAVAAALAQALESSQ